MGAFSWMLAYSAVSLAVLVIAFVASRQFTGTVRSFMADLRKMGNTHSAEIQKIIAKELSPSIHLHDGPEAVATRMQHIIRQVADDPTPENRQITFYGAASLAAMPDDKESEGSEPRPTSETPSPSAIYWKAIQHASNNQVRMRRYISLFTELEIRDRSPKVQSQYLNWLRRQYQLLSDDGNYQLINVPRAPQWGTNMARIIAKGVVMEITGNGRAAIVITDEHIAERIRQYAREAITGQNPLNPPIHFGLTIEGTLEGFKRYAEGIAAACNLTKF